VERDLAWVRPTLTPLASEQQPKVTVLEISGLRKHFGGVVALAGVDATIRSDEILGIIGPNGSGKTTLFNAVCGVYRPDAGAVRWNGVDITGRPAFEIGRLGIGRTFQQAMSFSTLPVRENVQIAIEHGSARRDGATRHWSSPEEILEFVGLGGFAEESANAMPFGNLRRLGIAVALGGHPSQLLLDEPAAGLNEGESAELVQLIRRVHELGIGVCVIDHHVGMMAEVCSHLIVLHFGNKIADGPTEAVLRDERVVEVYLGGQS
jgi:branched-chain amino acid transport system ATP-binding protein